MTIELPAGLAARLDRLGEVRSVRPLVGGRGGRTLAVDHGDVSSVVHLRSDVDGLLREAEAARRAHAAGVGPEVLDVVPGAVALVTRWVPGAVLTETDLRDRACLDRVGAAVRALHSAPVDGLSDYDPVAWRAEYLDRAAGAGRRDDPVLASVRARTDGLVADLVAAPAPRVLAHADLVASNLVQPSAAGVVVLDYEYAGGAEAAFDLGNLVAGAELDATATARLVGAYASGDADTTGDAALLDRVTAWAEVVRHAWFVWVSLGEGLGPERARWEAWAARTRAGWVATGGSAGPGPASPE